MLSMMTGMFHGPQFQLRMTPASGTKRAASFAAPRERMSSTSDGSGAWTRLLNTEE